MLVNNDLVNSCHCFIHLPPTTISPMCDSSVIVRNM